MEKDDIQRGVNVLRAIEANARINKVLFQELEQIVAKAEGEFDVDLNIRSLGRRIDKLIETSDEFHEYATQLVGDRVTIPDHDDKDVLLAVQCCGK